jgi:glycolate oxidase
VAAAVAALAAALRGRGVRVETAPHVLRLYGYDATGVYVGQPDAVVYPASLDELAAVVALAAGSGVPVVARGSGTGLSGGSVPVRGGLVVSFEAARRVLAVDADAMQAHVEAGVVNGSLDPRLRPHGLFYPPDPASHRVSTIGGNIAENAGGPHAVKYGVTGHHVVDLTVVDAEGEVGRLEAGAVQPGSDLVSLVVGSEGTLALVWSATLRLRPRPAQEITLLVAFADMARATDFVSAVVAAGLLPSTLEFIDRNTIAGVEAWGVAQYPEGAGAVLILELAGDAEEVAEEARRVEAIAAHHPVLTLLRATTPEEREALWLGRRGAYAAAARHGRRLFTQDVTVPRARLTEMMAAVEAIAARHGLMVATVGHAGDGNLHPDFPYDPDDPEESRRVHAANREVLEACVRLGGSITGEHGVGVDKIHELPLMYGPAELGLMAAVRRALDPHGILNPGKAVPDVPRAAPDVTGRPDDAPADGPALAAAVLRARATGRPLAVTLERLCGVALDVPNMTVTVGAGESLGTVSDRLRQAGLVLPVRPLVHDTAGLAVLDNDYGPEHVEAGTFRHALLAVEAVTGAGELVRLGRAVVKNVAGYDLARLIVGSRGRLMVPVAFVFRVLPARKRPWAGREFAADEAPPWAHLHRSLAAFALSDGGRWLFLAEGDPAPGWSPVPDAPQRLSAKLAALVPAADLLDVAFPAERWSAVAQAVGGRTALALPAASRLLVRLPRDEAEALVAVASDSGRAPVRASYGGEELVAPTGLTAKWEDRLRAVFDPDRVLHTWFSEEVRRRVG